MGDTVTDRSVSAAGYGRFLIAVFEQWVRRDVGRVFVQIFDDRRQLPRHPGVTLRPRRDMRYCTRARTQRRPPLLRPLRRTRPPARQHHRTAHARTRRLPAAQDFGNAERDSLPAYCRRCDVRFACNGGCPKDRFTTTPDGEPGLHYLCPGYQAFFHHVDRPMRVWQPRFEPATPPTKSWPGAGVRTTVLRCDGLGSGKGLPPPRQRAYLGGDAASGAEPPSIEVQPSWTGGGTRRGLGCRQLQPGFGRRDR